MVASWTREMSETHGYLIDRYYKKDSAAKLTKQELNALVANFRFLLDEDEDLEDGKNAHEHFDESWELRIVRAYHQRLFKEYCLTDFRLIAPPNSTKLALRWRTESEVISGKGQFVCGNLSCNQIDGLTSWQVDFNYVEKGQKKSALVKIRLCPNCSALLPKNSKNSCPREEKANSQSKLLP